MFQSVKRFVKHGKISSLSVKDIAIEALCLNAYHGVRKKYSDVLKPTCPWIYRNRNSVGLQFEKLPSASYSSRNLQHRVDPENVAITTVTKCSNLTLHLTPYTEYKVEVKCPSITFDRVDELISNQLPYYILWYKNNDIMHQSIPSTNIPPRAGSCTLLLPRGRDLYFMTFPGGRVFAYP